MRNGLLLALALSAGVLGTVLSAPAPAADTTDTDKWAKHTGDLPFVIGYANGMKQVEFTGKPPMLFFTATW